MAAQGLRRLRALFLFFLGFAVFASAFAAYPDKPIRFVVPFAPGGGTDIIARTLGVEISKDLGQPVIVDNKPGAGTLIGTDNVAKSAPDGYTVLIASPSSILVNPLLMPKLGYDAKRDLVPVSKVSSSPLVVAVNPSLGATTLRELIDAAKRQPGKLNFASSGNGSAPHLAAVHFMRLAGVEMVHVPYKGGGPAVQALLAGDTQLSFATPPSVLPLVQAGRLRALAITSRNGSALVPGVPGMVEAGLPDVQGITFNGVFAPKATPADTVGKLSVTIRKALDNPDVVQKLAALGSEGRGSTPEEFAKFLQRESAKWTDVMQKANINVQGE